MCIRIYGYIEAQIRISKNTARVVNHPSLFINNEAVCTNSFKFRIECVDMGSVVSFKISATRGRLAPQRLGVNLPWGSGSNLLPPMWMVSVRNPVVRW